MWPDVCYKKMISVGRCLALKKIPSKVGKLERRQQALRNWVRAVVSGREWMEVNL